MDKPWPEWTYEELAREAQTGTRGQGAVVEASRRLIVVVQASSDSADKLAAQVITLTNTLRTLTWVLVGVGVVQIALMVWKA